MEQTITDKHIERIKVRILEKIDGARKMIDHAYLELNNNLGISISVKLQPNKLQISIIDLKVDLKFYTGQYVDSSTDHLETTQRSLPGFS